MSKTLELDMETDPVFVKGNFYSLGYVLQLTRDLKYKYIELPEDRVDLKWKDEVISFKQIFNKKLGWDVFECI